MPLPPTAHRVTELLLPLSLSHHLSLSSTFHPVIIAVNFAQTQSERHRPSFSSDGLGWAFQVRQASKGDLMTMTTKQLPESPLASRGGVPLFLVSNWESSRSLQPIYLGPSHLRLFSIDIGHFICIHSFAECRCLEEKKECSFHWLISQTKVFLHIK